MSSERDPMTAAELAELRGVLDKATPGEWAFDESRRMSLAVVVDGQRIVTHDAEYDVNDDLFIDGAAYHNLRLIAAAVNAIPRLLSLAESQGVEVERLQEQADRLCDVCHRDANGTPTGWCENRVEGRHACVCMTEAEPYQELQATIATLTRERDEARSCLGLFYDHYENGDTVTDDGDPDGAGMGVAVSLTDEEDARILAVVGGTTPSPTHADLVARAEAAEESLALMNARNGELVAALTPFAERFQEWESAIGSRVPREDAAGYSIMVDSLHFHDASAALTAPAKEEADAGN